MGGKGGGGKSPTPTAVATGQQTGMAAPSKPSGANASRAKAIHALIVDALKSAVKGDWPAVAAFGRVGMVAVARVKIGQKLRIYVGVKVPTGSFGMADKLGNAVTVFAKAAVTTFLREEVLLEGEEIADITATAEHAEDAIQNAITRDSTAAKIDPKTVTGTIGAASPVCKGICVPQLMSKFPNIVIENPE